MSERNRDKDDSVSQIAEAVKRFSEEADAATTDRHDLLNRVLDIRSELDGIAYRLGEREPVSITVEIGDVSDPEAKAIFAIMNIMASMDHWAGGDDVTDARRRVAAYIHARYGQ